MADISIFNNRKLLLFFFILKNIKNIKNIIFKKEPFLENIVNYHLLKIFFVLSNKGNKKMFNSLF